MPHSVSATEDPAFRIPMLQAVVACVLAAAVLVVAAGFGSKFVLHALLVQQASSTGMDWARHIEARVPGMSQETDASGKPVALKAPPSKEFTDMVNGMFAVGNIYQIDVINPDCYCDISLGSFAAKVGGAKQSPHQDHAGHIHHDGHAADVPAGRTGSTGQGNQAKSLPQPVVQHVFESKSKHNPRTFGSNKKNRWPVDRATVRSIIASGNHSIFIREGVGDNQPRTFGEVYHPVSINGELSYVLRVLVDLEQQRTQYVMVLQRGAGLFLLLLLCASGYPAIRYFTASKRQALANHRARFLATHDILTGISNRNAFQEQVPRILERCRQGGKSAILIQLDLNKFKEINDHCGHQAGDQLLRELAHALSASLPESAHVARLGGDEFVAVVGGLAQDEIDDVRFDDLPRAVSFDCSLTGQTIAATVSGGSACFPRDGKTLDELMRSADLALYDAKSLAKGGIRKFNYRMRADFDARVQLREEFKNALQNSQIEPFYQPLVSLETGQVVGFESLARWRHPEKGLLTPFVFEELLSDREIGQMVGAVMFESVVADMKAWRLAGVPFERITLNIGEGDLLQPAFASNILSTLNENGLSPSEFAIEVTETCMFGSNKAEFTRQLEQLRTAGCDVALDDFGTGYSSITQIKELPCTAVKVDKSFVRDVESNDADQAIIEALLKLGQSIGFKVVLEGVETEEQRDLLRSMGCRLAQGYHYSAPVPATEVPLLIDLLNGIKNQSVEAA
ncbi:MAG: putative bifunctional diguanylate cyclase/phosphodiesterase [Hyphomicrobiaceae bacterium]